MTKNDFKDFRRPFVAENIIFLDEIGSTNDYAKDLAKNGASAGTAIITAEQTAGRGRFGRSWDDGKADGIYMSVLLKPKTNSAHLTLMAGVCVANVLNGLLGCVDIKLSPAFSADYSATFRQCSFADHLRICCTHTSTRLCKQSLVRIGEKSRSKIQPTHLCRHNLDGEQALIKWPNDIVVCGKKICGILTEGGAFGAVLGIGINVGRESFPPELSDKATSLRILTGRSFERAAIIKLLLTELSAYYEQFEAHGISSFIDEYRTLCVNIGKTVAVHENSGIYRARAIDVDDDGGLLVELENGERRVLNSGEVSVRGVYGYL